MHSGTSTVPQLPPGEARSAYRTLGTAAAVERFGCGFMDKSAVREDQVQVIPDTYSVIYVITGRGNYLDAQGRRYPLQAGSCFQRQPDAPQSTILDPDSGWQECFLDIGPTLYHALRAMQVIRHECPVWEHGIDPTLPERFASLMQHMHAAGEAELPRLLATILHLLTECWPRPGSDEAVDPAIEAACRYLGEDFASQRDLQGFCHQQHWGYEALRKRFRRRMGLSPHQYRIRRRLDRACELLTASNLSISAIADELGYSTPFEFSAQFRRHIGIPPSQFRR